jgi:hypothetical protein
MGESDFKLELAAATSYVRLMNEAEECRKLYQRAGVPLPPAILRLLGESDNTQRQLTLRLPGPDQDTERLASKPPQAKANWISIWAEDASPTTLALAILREQVEPIRAKDLSDQVTRILPMIVGGSIYNLLKRLYSSGYLKKRLSRWYLVKKEEASVLSGKFLWGPPEIFAKTDLAALRREAILHILSNERSLQIMQIVEKLKAWDWVKDVVPISKDLLKLDMRALNEAGKVRRVGNSRNWEVVEK